MDPIGFGDQDGPRGPPQFSEASGAKCPVELEANWAR